MCTLLCMSFHLYQNCVSVCVCFLLAWIQANQCEFGLDLSKLVEEGEMEETEGGETESSPTLPTPPPPLHKYQQVHHHDLSN